MTAARRRVAPALRRLPRALAAALLAAALMLPAAPSAARAADITFGTPASTSTYNGSIVFTVDLTAGVPLRRVELRLRYPGAIGPFISEVDANPGATGPQRLRYELKLTGGAHLVPNTTIEATWAAIPEDGSAPVLSAPETVHYEDTSEAWKTLRGDIVTVHWVKGDDAFARAALKIGEDAVASTAKLLGVSESKRIDFFIYPDEASFRGALGPGTRENVGGQAHADIRTLFALITPDQINDAWVEVVIPHELVHLVFDTAVQNPYRFPPRWVNEGLAVYLSEGFTPSDRNLVADATAAGDLVPLTALTGQFPTDPDKTYLAYAEAVSAIDYLVATFGEDALWSLVKAYKDGLTDDEAFMRATGKAVAGFEAGWLANLGAKAPVEYGPKPAPSGPVPPGWDGTAGAPPASPGAGNGSTGSSGSSAAPRATASAASEASAPSSSGDVDGPLLFVAIGAVVVVVVGAMALARRRTAGP